MKAGAAALLALAAAAPALAGTTAPVDPAEPPWTGYVRVTNNVGGSCTGALIARDRVITAAHCLYHKGTGALLSAVSLHVIFGYDRGAFTGHSLVKSVVTGDWLAAPDRGAEKIARDWAILDLAKPAPDSAVVLPLAGAKVTPGMAARLAGFRRSKAHILTADVSCGVLSVRRTPSGDVLEHSCAAEKGVSGGPLVVQENGRWVVAGLLVGHSTERPSIGYAVGINAFADRLLR